MQTGPSARSRSLSTKSGMGSCDELIRRWRLLLSLGAFLALTV